MSKIKGTKFSEGKAVKVRPKEEIIKGLDSSKKRGGCLMMEQMWEYCGGVFKVKKVVRNIFDENEYKMYGVHSPFYILEGLICDGAVDQLRMKCDRSCFFLWHEEWLEAV